ncbi:uncharacterized protein MONBRDRAFT_31863 [Monosiga brevicollis MX1]|uniref:Sulfotransferase domain-containing protein n=1 Tax=Monosiga brevicollis TaxID=81824 RepID=A9UVV9_MONBE|nr:uncharacterized protein MONBRDRAFT_31863 [Monosiga brevicollis MX1]EDQ90657.1 predicted protein [Monosiga brevicollis MX1]|eukprot:XP_001744708.1 hypothetical protein [Monosiga brevicollis MX1]
MGGVKERKEGATCCSQAVTPPRKPHSFQFIPRRRSLSLSLSLSLSNSQTLSLSLKLSLSLSNSLSLKLSQTLSNSLKLSQTLSNSQTLSLKLSQTLKLSLSNSLKLSQTLSNSLSLTKLSRGTTSLFHYLTHHPETRTNINGTKEFHILHHGGTLEDYNAHFPTPSPFQTDAAATPLCVDGSVSSLISHAAPRRLHDWCGSKVKLIAVLREPVTRIASTFLMRQRLGIKSVHPGTPFGPWLHKELNRFRQQERAWPTWVQEDQGVVAHLHQYENEAHRQLFTHGPHDSRFKIELFEQADNVIYDGLYAFHLERWFKVFPRDNFLILFYDELFANGNATVAGLERIYRFLGLPTLPPSDLQQIVRVHYNTRLDDHHAHPELSDYRGVACSTLRAIARGQEKLKKESKT